MSFSTRTNGKLLLSGEYFVTEGAVALALPTKLGQSLQVESGEVPAQLQWEAYEPEQHCWFKASFDLANNFDILAYEGDEDPLKTAETLQKVLRVARSLNPKFLTGKKGHLARTDLEFPRHWGLGSSATLVSMIAQWAKIEAQALLAQTFGGSGYDLVTATANGPVLYQRFNGQARHEEVDFNPSFKDQLYFVYLNAKQDSREAMVHYMITPSDQRRGPMQAISQLTYNLLAAAKAQPELAGQGTGRIQVTFAADSYEKESPLATFEALLEEHETIVQMTVKQARAKERYFEDYWGAVKSLGAWGGDFVLVTSDRSEAETKAYFEAKGFSTVLSYDELIKG